MSYAERLSKIRARLGISAESVARRMDVTLHTYILWEKDVHQPRGLYRKAVDEWIEFNKTGEERD